MLAFSSLLGNVEGQNIYRIWYDKPASYWEEALPVGNGRIAAMVFGDPQLEQIQLNEETVSAGSPYQNYNEEAKTALPEMRRLIFEGKYEEAQNMAATKILSQVGNEMPYQTVGRLNIRYQDHKKVNNYYRDLDISNAVADDSLRSRRSGIYRRNICIIYRSTGYQAYQSIQTGNNQLRTVF